MPIADFKCVDCGNIMFDIRLEGSIDFLTCSECGSANTYKMVSKSSFSLSGSGWAKDGYVKK